MKWYFPQQVYKALQDKCLSDLDAGMDQIIENLKPSNIQIEQSSIATSNSLSIIESVNGADVDNPDQEEERVADAFSVLSRYFETLSSQLQVAISSLSNTYMYNQKGLVSMIYMLIKY